MAFIPSRERAEVPESTQAVYDRFTPEGAATPEWVKVMAHRPEILEQFAGLFGAVMQQGIMDPLLKWKVAHTVSVMLKCPFCIDVTKKMLQKFGADDDAIAALQRGESADDKEQRIITLVRDVTDNANIDQPKVFTSVKDELTPEEIVELVSVIGLFNYINRFNNTLGVVPE